MRVRDFATYVVERASTSTRFRAASCRELSQWWAEATALAQRHRADEIARGSEASA